MHDLEWEWAGVSVPTDLIAQYQHALAVPKRQSRDNIYDPEMGGRLIRMCRDQNLVILNGRLPGDTHGAFTFFADGREGRSVVDYIISTPGLAFQPTGRAHAGVKMEILRQEECPKRPGGGNFDHVPVTLTIQHRTNAKPSKVRTRTQEADVSHTTYRWDKSYMEPYSRIVQDDREVQAFLQGLSNRALNIDQVESLFHQAIITSLGKLNQELRRNGKKGCTHAPKQRSAANTYPCNAWYDGSCRDARRKYMDTERTTGASSGEAKEAYKNYKRVTRSAKRRWEHSMMKDMVSDLYNNPKQFWTRYKRNGPRDAPFSVHQWTEYFSGLLASNRATSPPGLPPRHPMLSAAQVDHSTLQARVNNARSLNWDIMEGEVAEALKHACNGKAPGDDGLPMEFFKYALAGEPGQKVNVLIPVITSMFNRVLREGYPKSWSKGVIAPVPKPKGNPSTMDDYRGITVGKAISKLYSLVIMKRLDTWAETSGFRAAGQAGFREEKGTADNIFILSHLVEKYRAQHRPIYAVFIDFRKAYDCIDRNVLWDCLKQMGLHGNILSSIMGMYREVPLSVRVKGEQGNSFTSEVGVKQGDPLSPLLFGLLIDHIENILSKMLPQVGVDLAGSLVRVLLYADDLVLLAESPPDLQQLLDALSAFCQLYSLTVNVRKSEAMVFNGQPSDRAGLTQIKYNGAPMEVKPVFLYLGILFHERDSIQPSVVRNLDKGRKAMYAMVRRCYALGIHNVHLKCHLFDNLVKPILSYGCEIWCPLLLHKHGIATSSKGAASQMEQLHLCFLYQCLGVRRSTPTLPLLYELQREPLAVGWLKQAVRFWNKVHARRPSDLTKRAMQESCSMAAAGNKVCWAYCFQKCLGAGGNAPVSTSIDENDAASYMIDDWLRRSSHTLMHEGQVEREVRSVPDHEHRGFKILTYFKWFATVGGEPRQRKWWFYLHDREHICTMAQFRLGSHWLDIEIRRFRDRTSRSLRVCRCCTEGVREDEMHILTCPLYQDIRISCGLTLPSEIASDADMNGAVNPPLGCHEVGVFWYGLANYLVKCKVHRDVFLRRYSEATEVAG